MALQQPSGWSSSSPYSPHRPGAHSARLYLDSMLAPCVNCFLHFCLCRAYLGYGPSAEPGTVFAPHPFPCQEAARPVPLATSLGSRGVSGDSKLGSSAPSLGLLLSRWLLTSPVQMVQMDPRCKVHASCLWEHPLGSRLCLASVETDSWPPGAALCVFLPCSLSLGRGLAKGANSTTPAMTN